MSALLTTTSVARSNVTKKEAEETKGDVLSTILKWYVEHLTPPKGQVVRFLAVTPLSSCNYLIIRMCLKLAGAEDVTPGFIELV